MRNLDRRVTRLETKTSRDDDEIVKALLAGRKRALAGQVSQEDPRDRRARVLEAMRWSLR